MKGLIFSVKRYSVHDGPGIRVTFFLKGCPLSCRWCHNPEGLSPEPEIVTRTDRVGDLEFFQNEQAGRYYSVGEILEIVEKERIFIQQSGGGVTFSGGEPLMQAPLLAEALKACMLNGFHTAVDTSGYCTADKLRKIIPYTGLFLFDIKHLDNEIHLQQTSVSNFLILGNLRILLDSGKDIMLRIPLIPGMNDDPGHLSRLRDFIIEIQRDNVKRISLLPYHAFGSSKYKRFRISCRMNGIQPPSPHRMRELKDFFAETGIEVKIGG
jgi:pyruvate formate lyase activating enzyme